MKHSGAPPVECADASIIAVTDVMISVIPAALTPHHIGHFLTCCDMVDRSAAFRRDGIIGVRPKETML
jgi:hypothetical protein